MTTLMLQKTFEACQTNKSAWLQRRDELTQAEQAYREQLVRSGHSDRSLQTLREIVDVKKWKINQAAGRYIRSYEELHPISIRNRLNDFMQAHGAELAAALAPELMNYSGEHSAVQRCAMQHSLDCLRDALLAWLAAGEKINYSAQDNDALTAIGFMPHAASRDDSREKFTPAQNLNYTRRRAELAVQ
ncbi:MULTISPECIES: phage polarity suppression protein [Klebsiella]|uniref:phage polarity suppression protein n=1 Tax=Klebsiella TaxID=570 RepID=UPI001EECB57D|nr:MULTISPECIES: phage polarity suppression protein [Klebsiella]MCS6027758.1 Polarity suppression protein [Klebsiella quasipneumoniae subsp. quasipneumoniae]MDK1757451.1 Polarity suppression protein [Klebsiella sp. K5-322]MDK1842652.1 Polarity suppression protein [Klebsiella sp. K5-204]UPS75100.1 Polarity suppression protein [Klebsiella quasipneumoniae]HCB1243623.1 Polarity suppression protein [Klebsiella quasipneumoniae subsp. quasipneumoniae]